MGRFFLEEWMLFPYLACQFGKNTLSILVKECFGEDFPDIVKKKQVNYIFNYLKDLDAKTVLLESDYVDKDYLEDYSRYYVKCFNRYGERCARLHFFKEEISHTQFDDVFKENSSEITRKIINSYLGFVVIKPIPKTFIGKTCLKVCGGVESNNNKHLITKKYKVNLFGISLSVNSIAFQEQDKVLSACATTAIWTVLNAVKDKNVRDIRSSGEITLSAINYITNSANTFPNKGLTNKQILRALDTENLRHHLFNINDEYSKNKFFNIIKAYIDSDIPILLGVDVYEVQDDMLVRLDGHAVSVLGYEKCLNETVLYLHDDRVGPFVRAIIGDVSDVLYWSEEIEKPMPLYVVLQEKDGDGKWQTVEQVLKPTSIIVPTDKKVRIPATYIQNTSQSILEEYDSYIQGLKNEGREVGNFENCLTYSVRLHELSDIRSKVMRAQCITRKREILTKSSAKHLWSAEFYYNSEISFEILFDATDIPQGRIVSDVVVYDEEKYNASIVGFRRLINAGCNFPESGELNFLGSFISYLRDKDSEINDYLNENFGELRAPQYIKESEVEGGVLQRNSHIVKIYGRENIKLVDKFPSTNVAAVLIWAISHDGAVLIGKESPGKGHPTLTGFKPARIAGELVLQDNGKWKINSKSGRYSGDYDNANVLLRNAINKFLEVFANEKIDSFTIEGGY